MMPAYTRSAEVGKDDGPPLPLPLHLETGDRFIEVTSRLQIIAEHTQCLEAHHRGIGLSDVQHQLMERDGHQHDQPEDVTRNIGIKRLNYATETVSLVPPVFFAAWPLLGFVVTPVMKRKGARWFQLRPLRMLELALPAELGFRSCILCETPRDNLSPCLVAGGYWGSHYGGGPGCM